MHVAYVNQDKGIRPSKKKGARVHVESMVDAFRSLGARVTLIEEAKHDVALAALRELHAREPLSLVYERYSLCARAGAEVAREAGIPHVVEVNAPLVDEARAHREEPPEGAEDAERFVFEHARRVFAVSTQVAEYAVVGGADAERVVVTPNAVDSARFRPRPELRGTAAGIPGERIVLGFHGRLRPWHAFPRWVDAAAWLVERGHDVHVLTVGEGEFDAELADRIPAERRTSLGWLPHDEVAEHVARFDVLPLSYAPDAPCYFSPLKLLEGMACGAVPVVPALGDLPEAVRDGSDGIVYDARRPDALREALERVVVDAELREALSEGAIATAAARSWVAIAERALAVAAEVSTP